MRETLRKWLGITSLEKRVGVEKKSEDTNIFRWAFAWDFMPQDLTSKTKQLRDDFEELDKKFDELEKYLQIEYYKIDTEVQVYEWADKEKTEGFRKTKPYKEIKAAKEVESDMA